MKKYVKASTADKVRLHVEWYPYERFGGGGGKHSANFSANNMLEALAKLAENLLLYQEPEDILAGEYGSPEEVLERMISSNGDGCDYIVILQNKDTGEMLIDEDYEEEDWDEDWDE